MVATYLCACTGTPTNPELTPLETLARALEGRRLLIILDNCEHLVQECASAVTAILDSGEGVHVLATSREALGINGEIRWLVPALASPRVSDATAFDLGDPALPTTAAMDPTEAAQFDAIKLFLERANSVRPGFSLTADNVNSVAAICSRLDGIPLAIELAAARINLLTPEQIEARLNNRFALLTGGSRAAWPRHQTLSALIEWSYDLLSQQEQSLFRQLSIFSSGWTIDTMAHVVDGHLSDDCLNTLGSLLQKSLITEMPSTSPEVRRFSMLETLREFGRECLKNSSEYGTIAHKHIECFRDLAVQVSQGMIGTERARWLSCMDEELDNVRTAIVRGLQLPDSESSTTEICCSMVRYWYTRGMFLEGKQWLEAAFASFPQMPDEQRARAHNGAGSFCWAMGDYDCATSHYAQHLDIRRKQNDPLGLGYALQNLGLVAMHQGQYPEARRLMEESLPLLRQHIQPSLLAGPLINLAIIAKDMGEYAYAESLLNESLELHAAANNNDGKAAGLIALGNLRRRQGNTQAARETMLQALALTEEISDQLGQSIVLHNLGEMAQTARQYPEARGYFEASLKKSKALRDRRQAATTLFHLAQMHKQDNDTRKWHQCIEESAQLARQMKDLVLLSILAIDAAERFEGEGKPENAAMLLSCVESAREQQQIPYSSEMLAAVEALKERLGAVGAWPGTSAAEEGKLLTLEEAAALASAV